MRGTLLADSDEKAVEGIIPAYAGNTFPGRWSGHVEGDHPRVCGEHRKTQDRSSAFRGSSPRMRGTPTGTPRVRHRLGIIPAYAGNTRHHRRHHRHAEDHPRVCGEHESEQPPAVAGRGSSPRMRGTRFRSSLRRGPAGIIPAYAGNTQRRRTPRPRGRDHPRVCGEHEKRQRLNADVEGSSPRMRGTPSGQLCCQRNMGIIPAYAGNTLA